MTSRTSPSGRREARRARKGSAREVERIDPAERRRQFLDAAVTVIRRDGPGASMEAIAREAGVTKPILYRHFGDRDGLVVALGEEWAAELTANLFGALDVVDERPPREAVAGAIDAYIRLIDRDPELYRFLTNRFLNSRVGPAAPGDPRGGEAGPAASLIDGIGRNVAITLGEQMRAAGADSGAAEPWALGIVGLVHSAGDWWVQRRTLPRERLVAYLVDLVWDGMGRTLSAPAGDGEGPAGQDG